MVTPAKGSGSGSTYCIWLYLLRAWGCASATCGIAWDGKPYTYGTTGVSRTQIGKYQSDLFLFTVHFHASSFPVFQAPSSDPPTRTLASPNPELCFSSRGAWTVKQIGHLPWLHSDDTGCVVKSSCSPMKRANGLIDWLAGWHSHTRDGSGSSSSSGKKRFLGGCPPVQSSPVAGE